MLRELRGVRQIAGESHRRCFSDPDMDLTVWVDEDGGIKGFELCYDKIPAERAVRWVSGMGFDHTRVDDGEQSLWENMTPILVPDGEFPAKKISRLFQDNSRDMDRSIAEFVYRKLLEYPE
jgi:hypothetical protein